MSTCANCGQEFTAGALCTAFPTTCVEGGGTKLGKMLAHLQAGKSSPADQVKTLMTLLGLIVDCSDNRTHEGAKTLWPQLMGVARQITSGEVIDDPLIEN